MYSCARTFNGFPISSDFCCLLITNANSLDRDQYRREKKLILKKKPADANKSWENYPAGKALKKGLMLWRDCTASQERMCLTWLLTHAIST